MLLFDAILWHCAVPASSDLTAVCMCSDANGAGTCVSVKLNLTQSHCDAMVSWSQQGTHCITLIVRVLTGLCCLAPCISQ